MTTSFRLIPNAIQGGETTELVIEGASIPADLSAQRLTIEIRSRDKQVARFSAKASRQGQHWSFSDVKRTDGNLNSLPGETPVRYRNYKTGKTLKHAAFTVNPTYPVPHFKITLRGGVGPEEIILLDADEHEPHHPYLHTLSLRVSASGKMLFDRPQQKATVDCAPLLATACFEATRALFENHKQQIDRTGFGTHYGSEYENIVLLEGTRPLASQAARKRLADLKDLQGKGLDDRSCVGLLLSALSMGHEGYGATEVWKKIKKDYLSSHSTKNWGPIIKRSGAGLLKGLVDHAGWSAVGVCLDPTHKDVTDVLDRLRRHGEHYEMVAEDIIWSLPQTINPARAAKAVPKKDDLVKALKSLPFAVLIIDSGRHTAILHNGQVYEVHWSGAPDDKSLYDPSHSIDKWTPYGQQFGAQLSWIAVPPRHWVSAKRRQGLVP